MSNEPNQPRPWAQIKIWDTTTGKRIREADVIVQRLTAFRAAEKALPPGKKTPAEAAGIAFGPDPFFGTTRPAGAHPIPGPPAIDWAGFPPPTGVTTPLEEPAPSPVATSEPPAAG